MLLAAAYMWPMKDKQLTLWFQPPLLMKGEIGL
jgi:hypothetical protein